MEIIILGQNPISGSIQCGGAKNLAIKVIIGSILTRSVVKLYNIPNIHDVDCSLAMCRAVGMKIAYEEKALILDARNLSIDKINMNTITSRMPILFLTALLNFFDEVTVPSPAGCDLGNRKLNFHVQILEKFGHRIEEYSDKIVGMKKPGTLEGVRIELPYPSVGATETALFASVLAKGTSIINNIAIEPEIKSLVLFLQGCGAKIIYTGERELTIEGVCELNGTNFEVDGDRIEAASWACLACAADGKVAVSGINIEHLSTFLGIYRSFGGDFKLISKETIEFSRAKTGIKPVFLETGPYPQLSTDYQPIISSVLVLSSGNSVLHETLFDNRLGYLDFFSSFNVSSTKYTQCIGNYCHFRDKQSLHSAIINGSLELHSPTSPIHVDTIRSGFAYIILAAIANGSTQIKNMKIVERGIEKLYEKLELVGVQYRLLR